MAGLAKPDCRLRVGRAISWARVWGAIKKTPGLLVFFELVGGVVGVHRVGALQTVSWGPRLLWAMRPRVSGLTLKEAPHGRIRSYPVRIYP